MEMGWLKDDAYTWRGMCSVCNQIREFRHGRCNADNPTLDSLNPREPSFNPNYVRHQPVNQEKNTRIPDQDPLNVEKTEKKIAVGLPLFPNNPEMPEVTPFDETEAYDKLPTHQRPVVEISSEEKHRREVFSSRMTEYWRKRREDKKKVTSQQEPITEEMKKS